MEFTLNHPLLGQVTGLKKPGVAQFLGVQYATLTDRFAAPKLRDEYGGHVSATRYGPTVLAPPIGCDLEFQLIQCPLDKPEFPGMSDVDGLNLNITVPADDTPQPAGGFPVVVFVHGGGLALGGNWWPQADFANLVRLSGRLGKPVIGVAINYRLGVCGFLDSEQLRARGYPPNRGLLDQSVAFQWVRKHIAGFGGNPRAVTAMGQSAGSFSVMLHLDSPEELFQRAVCLSGTPLALPAFPPQVAEQSYAQVLGLLGLGELSADEQVAGLLGARPDDILAKIPPSVALGPTIDDGAVVVKSPPSFARLAAAPTELPPWCAALMVGAASHDAGVFELLGLFAGRDPSVAASFVETLERTIPAAKHDALGKLLRAYGIAPDLPDDEASAAVLRLFNDVHFFAAALAYAASWRRSAYLYYMTEPNPWPGRCGTDATHVQDVAFLFQNYADKMSERQRAVGEAFAADVCALAYGEAPYPELKDARKMRLYGPPADGDAGAAVSMVSADATGPSEAVRALWRDVGLDELSRALAAYQSRG